MSKTPIITKSLATYIASLQQCAINNNLKKGQQLHAQLLTTGLHSISPAPTTSLINMYAKCKQINQAHLVFNTTPNENCNVFAYNAMISGFVSNGLAKDGLKIYRQMRMTGIMPDNYTFPCLIKGICEVMQFFEVIKIHGLLFKLGLELDVFVGSALVSGHLRLELIREARQLFDEMLERDVGLWNSMVNGCAQRGLFNEALGYFRRMSEEGVPVSEFTVTGVFSVFALMGDFDNGRVVHCFVVKFGFDSDVSVCNGLIDMYGKCKCVGDAIDVFEMMDAKDIFSWNSVISVHEQCGDHDGTLRFFDRMLHDGVWPDLVTITTILPVCSSLAALRRGRGIHGYMIINSLAEEGKSDDIDVVQLNNAVMDMYAKCGSMRDAQMVFHKMSNKDIASWNIMILGYAKYGHGNEALGMFSRMLEAGFKPNEITFLAILSACSHAGFVSQGREFFMQMESKCGVVPTVEHYACMIDLLGRAGQLEEAYRLAKTAPIDTNVVLWRALLSACQLHGNSDLAEAVAQRVLELEPEHCGNYVLMSNVCVAAGRYEEVLDVRHTMKLQNVKKIPGCSWIELKDGMHTFITCDGNHPGAKSIYSQLHSLIAHLHEHEYVPCI